MGYQEVGRCDFCHQVKSIGRVYFYPSQYKKIQVKTEQDVAEVNKLHNQGDYFLFISYCAECGEPTTKMKQIGTPYSATFKRGNFQWKNGDPHGEVEFVPDPNGRWVLEDSLTENNKHNKMNNLTFGQALDAVKQGKLIARQGWNGKGMFVFQRPEDELSVDFIVNKVKSLPQSLKDKLAGDFSWTQQEALDGNGPDKKMVKFTAYLCMKAADGTIVNGWLASQTDMLAEDWVVLE